MTIEGSIELSLSMCIKWGIWRRSIKNVFFPLEVIGGTNPVIFQSVCKNDIPIVENLVQSNVFLYDVVFVDGTVIGEVARGSHGKHSNTVQLFNYRSETCFVFDIQVFFKPYPCPSCDNFFSRAPNLVRLLTTRSGRVKHMYQKREYQLCETMFDKLDSFFIPHTDNKKVFNWIFKIDFESICVEDEDIKETEPTSWIEKHMPFSVSILSNLIKEPIYFIMRY